MAAALITAALMMAGHLADMLPQSLAAALATPLATTAPPVDLPVDGPRAAEAYRWRPVRIGGGGMITGMAFDAHGTTMVARTDVHGAWIWQPQANEWRLLTTAASMPAAYRAQSGVNAGVYEIAVAPGDANRLYMAIKGRILRSDDRGEHWQQADAGAPVLFRFDANDAYRRFGPFMAVSPANPDVVLFGSPEQGLWRSFDGAKSWQKVPDVPPASDQSPAPGVQAPGISVWFMPDGKGVLAASAGHGVFAAASADGPFRPVGAPGSGPEMVARGAFAPDGAFYAVEHERQRGWVLRGGVWSDLAAQGLPAAPFLGVAVRGDQVLVSAAGGAMWCSANRGQSWTGMLHYQGAGAGDPPWLGLRATGWFDMGQIAFDPAHPDTLWAATGTAPFRAQAAHTCLWPVHWQSQARGIEELVATDIVQSPGRAPMFAALDFGIHVKADLGAFSTTFGPKPRFTIAAQQVAISPADPDFAATNASDTRQCCAEDGQSVLAGTTRDGGKSWQRFATLPTPPGTSAQDPWRMAYGTLAVSARDPGNIVWAPGRNRAPFVTRDYGASWAQVHLPGEVGQATGSFPNIWINRKTLAADGATGGVFYLYHSGEAPNRTLAGLWRSGDGGRNWAQVWRGEIAPGSGGAAKLRAVPGQEGHLFFTSASSGTDQRLRQSMDGGAHWALVPGVEQVDDIAFGKAARGNAYPTIYLAGRVKGAFGLWRSVDKAASWQRLVDFPLGRLDQITVLAADPLVFGRVYVGFMGSGFVYGESSDCTPAALAPQAPQQCSAVDAPLRAGQ